MRVIMWLLILLKYGPEPIRLQSHHRYRESERHPLHPPLYRLTITRPQLNESDSGSRLDHGTGERGPRFADQGLARC
jgi:hypothetical protein